MTFWEVENWLPRSVAKRDWIISTRVRDLIASLCTPPCFPQSSHIIPCRQQMRKLEKFCMWERSSPLVSTPLFLYNPTHHTSQSGSAWRDLKGIEISNQKAYQCALLCSLPKENTEEVRFFAWCLMQWCWAKWHCPQGPIFDDYCCCWFCRDTTFIGNTL